MIARGKKMGVCLVSDKMSILWNLPQPCVMNRPIMMKDCRRAEVLDDLMLWYWPESIVLAGI